MRINDKREHHCRVVFDKSNGGIYEKKSLIHVKGGYYVEVSGYDGKEVLLGVLDDNEVE